MKRTAILLGAVIAVVALIPAARAADEATADIKVSLTGPATVTAGGSATYRMTIRNDGPDSVTSAGMTATWSANLSVRTDGLTGVSGFCGWGSNPNVTCGVAGMPMAPGETRTVIITGVVSQTITGGVRMTTSARSNLTDPVPTDNSGQAVTEVVPACPPAAKAS